MSVRIQSPLYHRPITVAWFYPRSGVGWSRTHDFSFGTGILSYDDVPPVLDQLVREWADSFRDDSFTTDASSHGVAAWAVAISDVPDHTDALSERLLRILARLRDPANSTGNS